MEKRKCCEDCKNCDKKTNLTGYCNIKEEMLVLNSYCSEFESNCVK